MKPGLQRRIQKYGWDKAAPYYDTSWQQQLLPAQKKLLDGSGIKAGDSVLDISCGTGLVTQPIAQEVGTDGSVTGIDISKGMIEKAQTRVQNDNQDINFRQMDAEKLDFDANSFDAAICSLGLMYFPCPEKALEQMYRVTKPGSNTSALVWGSRSECGWASIFPIVDRRVKSDVCPLFFQLGTGNALQNSFKNAGFEEITYTRFSTNLIFENDEDACVAAFWGGAVALAYQKFDEETKQEAHKEYLDSIQKFSNGKGYHIPGEFVIVRGKK